MTGPGPLERRLAQAERACGDASITEWLRFQVAMRRGDAELARASWYRSLDLDALPLRAPSSADPIIRAVAQETGAELVDLEATWGPFARPAWFGDNLHLSTEGARAVGSALREPVRRRLGL